MLRSFLTPLYFAGEARRSATCVGQMAVGSPDAWNDLGTSHTSVIKMLSRCGGTLARLPVPGGASVDNTGVRYSDAVARTGLTVLSHECSAPR